MIPQTTEQFIPCIRKALAYLKANPQEHYQILPSCCVMGMAVRNWLGISYECDIEGICGFIKNKYGSEDPWTDCLVWIIHNDLLCDIYFETDKDRAITLTEKLLENYPQ